LFKAISGHLAIIINRVCHYVLLNNKYVPAAVLLSDIGNIKYVIIETSVRQAVKNKK